MNVGWQMPDVQRMARNLSSLIANGVEAEVLRGRDALENVAFDVQRLVKDTLPKVKQQLRTAGTVPRLLPSFTGFSRFPSLVGLVVTRSDGFYLISLGFLVLSSSRSCKSSCNKIRCLLPSFTGFSRFPSLAGLVVTRSDGFYLVLLGFPIQSLPRFTCLG